MKKNLLIIVIAFLAVFCAVKMTTIKSLAKASFAAEEEVVVEETSAEELTSEEVSEITEEVIEENFEEEDSEEVSEETEEVEITSEEPQENVVVIDDENAEETENKKGLLPDVPSDEDNKEAKGLIPTEEEEEGKVKADVTKIVVDHAGDKPNSANTTDEGKTAFCIEEENFHPDHTDYIEDQEAEIDCSKYDNAVVEYTISIQEGVDKTMADEALQSALWSINGSETDHEAVLRDNHGQAGVDLYNRYKNAALHEGWSVAYRVLKPVEEHRHGDYQVLITFEATKPEEEKITPPPVIPPQPEPEVDTEITPAVPETGDGNFNPLWIVSILGIMAVVAGVATSKKRA